MSKEKKRKSLEELNVNVLKEIGVQMWKHKCNERLCLSARIERWQASRVYGCVWYRVLAWLVTFESNFSILSFTTSHPMAPLQPKKRPIWSSKKSRLGMFVEV